MCEIVMSVDTTPILYEKRGHIALLTINRPEARNALTPEMLCRLADALTDFKEDSQLRVAILTATGAKAFCSGGDLALTLPLLGGTRQIENDWDERLISDPTVMQISSLRNFPLYKPVIAAINGPCLAGGMELVLGTDIRIATENSIFGLPEVTRALIPFAGSMVRLPRQIPYVHAMEMLLTGKAISSSEALTYGLINKVVSTADLLKVAFEYAQLISDNGPVALQAIKETVIRTSGLSFAEGYALEDVAKQTVFLTEDAVEGPRAFMEKRSPVYKGR
jgi:enoyl-CoA hydratase